MLLTLFLAAQAASAPAPLMVFFDSGKAELRSEWEPVLGQAVERLGSGGLLLIGHSDRSGSSAGNLRVSRARAELIADALVARGVERTRIMVTARGESEPLVPTADGVREIQNRRVDILVQP